MKTIGKERQGNRNLSYCSIEGTLDVISSESSLKEWFEVLNDSQRGYFCPINNGEEFGKTKIINRIEFCKLRYFFPAL